MISRNALTLALALAVAVPTAAQAADQGGTAAAPAGDAAKPADAPKAADIVVTGRFVDTGAKSAMKMNVRVLDTPATVSSYSQSFVKSLDTNTVSDLYNYMTGLKKSGNTGYDITLRGFKGSGDDRNTILVDGLPGLTVRYGSPGTVNIDHIELVKGPTSVLYGQAQPGGFVNLVTKSPQEHFSASAEIRANSFMGAGTPLGRNNGMEGEFDVTGPLTKSGSLSFRLTGQLSRIDSFRAGGGIPSTTAFIAPALTWRIDEDTAITVKAEYGHVRQHLDNGVVALPNGNIYDVNLSGGRLANYQEPTDYRVETGKTVSVFAHHDFGHDWVLHGSYRHVSYDSDQQSFDQTGLVTVQGVTEVQRRARELTTNRTYDYADINLNGSFHTGFIKHKLLVGVNFGSNSTENDRLKFYNSSTPNATTGKCPTGGMCLNIPVYNPAAYYNLYPSFASLPAVNPQLGAAQQSLLTDQVTRSISYGVYVSDLMEFTRWLKVSLAGRNFGEISRAAPDERNQPGVIFSRDDKKALLPSAGLLLEPNRHLTFYLSYSESFVPSDPSAIDGNGNVGTLHPVTAKQYEAGLKGENLLDHKLSFSAALYRIDQDGQVTQNPCFYGTCSYQTGKGRSDGFELQGDASPLRNWQMLFGYSHIVARILTSPSLPFQVGDELPNVARDAANVWSRYDFGHGIAWGLGVVYTGPRQGLLPTVATDTKLMPMAGYTTVDTGLYYDAKRFSVNLKIGNLFDKAYWESAGATGRIQVAPGAPRSITLSIKARI